MNSEYEKLWKGKELMVLIVQHMSTWMSGWGGDE